MKRVCACAALSLVLAYCGTVSGAVSEGQFSVSPMIGGYTYYGSADHLGTTAPMYSLRGGYSFTDKIGVEAGLDYSIRSYSTQAGDKDVATFKYGVEGLYHFMPEKALVPFLAAGLGGYNLSGPSALVSRKEMGFVDYGAGLKYFLTDNVALRADVRHVLANASAIQYTMGVTVPFGGAKGAAKPVSKTTAPEPVTQKPQEPAKEQPAPTVVAPELSPAEKLAQLKEQFAKAELERIAALRADWEKEQVKREAEEKAAREREAADQAGIRKEPSVGGEEHTSAETVQQTEKPATTDSGTKPAQKKRHKAAAKKKRHTEAAPQ